MAIRIDAGATVFTLINVFSVQENFQSAIVAELTRFTEEHASHLPGFVGAAVHASIDRKRVLNYVQWRNAAALDDMLETAAAREHLRAVAAMAERIDPVPYAVAFVRGDA